MDLSHLSFLVEKLPDRNRILMRHPETGFLVCIAEVPSKDEYTTEVLRHIPESISVILYFEEVLKAFRACLPFLTKELEAIPAEEQPECKSAAILVQAIHFLQTPVPDFEKVLKALEPPK